MKITKSELVEWMFEAAPASCNYWVDYAEWWPEAMQGRDIYQNPFSVTLAQFEEAITDWCINCAKEHGYDYFRTFAKDWLWGDYCSVDYDAEVVDHIFQWAVFSEIRYG